MLRLITGWRKWQWGSFMTKYLQASGNMLNNTAGICSQLSHLERNHEYDI
jgi:hypothetical protein